MAKLCVVTSVYAIRKSRPLDYYLTPTIHLLEDLSDSDINICLFTDQEIGSFPTAGNIHIFQPSPESLIKEMWDQPDWKSQPRGLEHPNLLAIWLGKLVISELSL